MVALTREELPADGEAWLAAPAVDLAVQTEPQRRGKNAVSPFVSPACWSLGSSDHVVPGDITVEDHVERLRRASCRASS